MTIPVRSLRTLRRMLSVAGGRREGATAVEFAMLLLPTLVLIMGAIEVGRFVWMQASLQFAVDAAARCAAVNAAACGSQTQLQGFAAALAPSVNFSVALQAPSAPCSGSWVVATVPFQTVVPHLEDLTTLFQRDPITLSAQACILQ